MKAKAYKSKSTGKVYTRLGKTSIFMAKGGEYTVPEEVFLDSIACWEVIN